MKELFYAIVNMSISAGILVLVVLLLRLLFHKAPKWVTILLWALVAVRLICPFAPETSFSLMPKTDWFTPAPAFSEDDMFLLSVPADHLSVDTNFVEDITVHYYPLKVPIAANRGVSASFVLTYIWLAGIAAMLLYMLVSYILVMRRIRGAKQFRDNIYTSESVSSPFVFGLIRPRIYLSENMDTVSMSYVIAHEKAHLRSLDHLWKLIGFLLLALHWFNPLIWLGYILFCRDIEIACDQRVIRDMDGEERANYSETLLLCSTGMKIISACPLAFGEVGVKERIKSVLSYKKPGVWIIAAALIACGAAAVCFLTNPITVRNPWVQEYVPGTGNILGQVDKEKYESVSDDFAIGADKYGRAVFKDPQKAFTTMIELCSEGLTLIREAHDLAPISQQNYDVYKKYGWQMTEGSAEAQTQAAFISGFLDIYENSFIREIPNTDLPEPTFEGENSYEKDLERLKDTLAHLQDLVPAYVVEKSYALACRTNIGRIEKNGYQVRKPEKDNDNFIEIVFMEENTGIYVGVNWMRKEIGAEWALVPGTPVMIYEPGRWDNTAIPQLSLTDVVDLATAKGKDLTWSDFAGYEHSDIGSGLHIWSLPIDDVFSVYVGGGSPMTSPMYIRLYARMEGGDQYIDLSNSSANEISSFISTCTKESKQQ